VKFFFYEWIEERERNKSFMSFVEFRVWFGWRSVWSVQFLFDPSHYILYFSMKIHFEKCTFNNFSFFVSLQQSPSECDRIIQKKLGDFALAKMWMDDPKRVIGITSSPATPRANQPMPAQQLSNQQHNNLSQQQQQQQANNHLSSANNSSSQSLFGSGSGGNSLSNSNNRPAPSHNLFHQQQSSSSSTSSQQQQQQQQFQPPLSRNNNNFMKPPEAKAFVNGRGNSSYSSSGQSSSAQKHEVCTDT
jgi:hypothetical protein